MAVLLPQPSTLMFMDRIEEGEAVIRSFTVPQKQSAISLSLSLLFIHTLSDTHTSVYRISFPHGPPLFIPSPFGLILPSPLQLCHPRETNSDLLQTVMACWPREMESFQVLGYSLPPSLLPCCCPLAASQHFLNTPDVSAG